VPTISAIVPTYRRPADLRRCLECLLSQTRRPDEIVVVCRDAAIDPQSNALIDDYAARDSGIRKAVVSVGGQVAALNCGVRAATSELLAITDDDGAPRSEWIARIVAHFESDPEVGGVGGRDWVHGAGGVVLDGTASPVGRITWAGKAIGNHHVGFGPPRRVEFLKGANMSYRAAALAGRSFDLRLRGEGSQMHNDLSIGLTLSRAGWALLYDPLVAIDHYPAVRHDTDARDRYHAGAWRNQAYNQILVVLTYLPPLRRAAFVAWLIVLGHRGTPGVLTALRVRLRERDPHAFDQLRQTVGALSEAIATLRRDRSPSTPPPTV
jgi:glycosyltransferase involved in cell wall biosynthesis